MAEDRDAVVVGVDGGVEVALGVLVKPILKGHLVGSSGREGVAVTIGSDQTAVVSPYAIADLFVSLKPKGIGERGGTDGCGEGDGLIVDNPTDIVGHLSQEASVHPLGGRFP